MTHLSRTKEFKKIGGWYVCVCVFQLKGKNVKDEHSLTDICFQSNKSGWIAWLGARSPTRCQRAGQHPLLRVTHTHTCIYTPFTSSVPDQTKLTPLSWSRLEVTAAYWSADQSDPEVCKIETALAAKQKSSVAEMCIVTIHSISRVKYYRHRHERTVNPPNLSEESSLQRQQDTWNLSC